MSRKTRIALIGPYPPPYGGIAIHIQRLKEQLESSGYNCVVYELGRREPNIGNIIRVKNTKKWLLSYLLFPKENIIHLHNPDWQMRVILGMLGLLGKKTVISIHGSSLEDSLNGGWLKRGLIQFALKRTSFILAVNPSIKDLALSLGVKRDRIEVITSFIKPTVKVNDIAAIPQDVWRFIREHTPIISANASRIVFYKNIDLYGIDMCLELCANLKIQYPKLGFIFCLPEVGDHDYLSLMKLRVINKGIDNNFFFQTKACELYPILMKSDIFVRPTNVDGYGISVAEAIFFKVPAVASDVCQRPKGTVLFTSRDINDFTNKVRDVLNRREEYVKTLNSVNLDENTEKIISVYNRIVN